MHKRIRIQQIRIANKNFLCNIFNDFLFMKVVSVSEVDQNQWPKYFLHSRNKLCLAEGRLEHGRHNENICPIHYKIPKHVNHNLFEIIYWNLGLAADNVCTLPVISKLFNFTSNFFKLKNHL